MNNTISVLIMDCDKRIFRLFVFCKDPTKISSSFNISRFDFKNICTRKDFILSTKSNIFLQLPQRQYVFKILAEQQVRIKS